MNNMTYSRNWTCGLGILLGDNIFYKAVASYTSTNMTCSRGWTVATGLCLVMIVEGFKLIRAWTVSRSKHYSNLRIPARLIRSDEHSLWLCLKQKCHRSKKIIKICIRKGTHHKSKHSAFMKKGPKVIGLSNNQVKDNLLSSKGHQPQALYQDTTPEHSCPNRPRSKLESRIQSTWNKCIFKATQNR